MSWLALSASLLLVLAGCDPADNGTTSNGDTDPDGGSGPEFNTGRPAVTVTGPSVTGDVIKIGLVASQNGPLRPWGIDSVNGAQLAVDEINASGGINGKQVQLLIGDSASKPEDGKTAAELLISQGIVGLLGEVASGITQPMAQLAYERGLPIVAVGATKTTITEIGANVFRVCYTDDLQGPVMAKFAYDELGLQRMAIITDKKQPYSTYLSDAFRDAFVGYGGEIVGEEFYESGQTQFVPQLNSLKQESPNGYFLSGYFTEVGPIVKQAAQAGITNVKFLGGDGWDSTDLLDSGGEAILGNYFCNHYNNKEDREVVRVFLAKWKDKYGGSDAGDTPGTTMGALGYDAAMVMMDAIRRAESLDAASIIVALEDTVAFKGVSGDITLKGAGGNPKKRALVVEVTLEGQSFVKAYEYTDIFTD
ncbi:MAG: ABC transporter substrate-binding protein [Armatimonadetes bacterium]|nr:ABC transporter substrate-binding protein [Armatimonadota bacterium]